MLPKTILTLIFHIVPRLTPNEGVYEYLSLCWNKSPEFSLECIYRRTLCIQAMCVFMWASLNMYHLCKYTCICIHYTQAPNVCLFIKSVLRDWKTWNLTFIFLSLSFPDQFTTLSFIVIEINVNIHLEKPFRLMYILLY